MWQFNCIIIKLTWKEPRSVWCNSVHAYSFSISSCIDQRRLCIIFLWKRWKIYIQAMQLLFIRCSRKAAKFIFMHIFQINIHWMNWIWRELCIVNLYDVVDCWRMMILCRWMRTIAIDWRFGRMEKYFSHIFLRDDKFSEKWHGHKFEVY
jgi:hypothetical protein